MASLSPLQTELSAQKDSFTVTDITLQAFDSGNVMAACDLNRGKFMACCLMYRGDVLVTVFFFSNLTPGKIPL